MSQFGFISFHGNYIFEFAAHPCLLTLSFVSSSHDSKSPMLLLTRYGHEVLFYLSLLLTPRIPTSLHLLLLFLLLTALKLLPLLTLLYASSAVLAFRLKFHMSLHPVLPFYW